MDRLGTDAYAAQHAGGAHPGKSVLLHLLGLHLVLDRDVPGPEVPALQQRAAEAAGRWPHLPPPRDRGRITVFDVALAGSPDELARSIRDWAGAVWAAWTDRHPAVREFAERSLTPA